jgi:hypothetical protein
MPTKVLRKGHASNSKALADTFMKQWIAGKLMEARNTLAPASIGLQEWYLFSDNNEWKSRKVRLQEFAKKKWDKEKDHDRYANVPVAKEIEDICSLSSGPNWFKDDLINWYFHFQAPILEPHTIDASTELVMKNWQTPDEYWARLQSLTTGDEEEDGAIRDRGVAAGGRGGGTSSSCWKNGMGGVKDRSNPKKTMAAETSLPSATGPSLIVALSIHLVQWLIVALFTFIWFLGKNIFIWCLPTFSFHPTKQPIEQQQQQQRQQQQRPQQQPMAVESTVRAKGSCWEDRLRSKPVPNLSFDDKDNDIKATLFGASHQSRLTGQQMCPRGSAGGPLRKVLADVNAMEAALRKKGCRVVARLVGKHDTNIMSKPGTVTYDDHIYDDYIYDD